MQRGHWCDIIVLNIHVPTGDKFEDMKDGFYEELECVFNKFPKYHMKILLDYNAKVGKEDNFKPAIDKDNLHEVINGNGVRVVNFATYKHLAVREAKIIIIILKI
jgi:hypothetical protein